MSEFDGVTIMPLCNWDAPDSIFSSDACLKSAGGWSDGEAFHVQFPRWLKSRKDVSIDELELITVIVAIKMWDEKMSNRNILTYCNNQASVEVVNTRRARNAF